MKTKPAFNEFINDQRQWVLSVLFVILAFMASGNGYAQDYQVKGMVTDATTGEPLPGVNIVITGTGTGAITDVNGKYAITVPHGNASLQFSYVGYNAETMTVEGETILDVILVPDIKSLDEVVVTGYGSVKKSDVTGAIASIKAVNLKRQPVTSFDDALQGLASGISIQTDGTPGKEATVLIRGVGSINGGNPLYVVDGIVADNISMINPSDIESIEILKDGSSAAIYGARAADGVILVTTKRGKKANGISVSLESYYGTQSTIKTLGFLNTHDYAMILNEASENNPSTSVTPRVQDILAHPEKYDNGTDWEDELLQNGAIQDHNLSITGGSENINFYLSGGYLRQDGIILTSNYEKYSFRFNSDIKVGKFKFGESVALSNSNRSPYVYAEWGREDYYTPIQYAIQMSPAIPVYDSLGHYAGPDDALDGINNTPNPVGYMHINDVNFNEKAIAANLYGQIDLFKGFSYRFNLGINSTIGHDMQHLLLPPGNSMGNWKRSYGDVIRLIEGNSNALRMVYENIFKYNFELGIHKFDLMGAITKETYESRSTSLTTEGYPGERFTSYNATTEIPPDIPGGSELEDGLLSYVGRINYSFNNLLVFAGTIRRDGSSKFGQTNKYGTFPSASLAWKISEHNFIKSVNAISSLKLRLGIGQLGRERIGSYMYQSSMTAMSDGVFYKDDDGNLIVGNTQQLARFPNRGIQWETETQTNIGIDGALFQNTLSFSFDYYVRKTSDMLLNKAYAPSGPSFHPWEGPGQVVATNVGSLQNKGFEITLGYVKKIGDVRIKIDGNLFTFKNKIISLGDTVPLAGAGVWDLGMIQRSEEGYPINQFYGYEVEKIFQLSDDTNGDGICDNQGSYVKSNGTTSLTQPKAHPGDLKFKDTDGNGQLTDDGDKVYIGNPIPDFIYSLNFGASYKGLELNIQLYGVHGNEIFNYGKYRRLNSSGSYNLDDDVLGRWTPENPGATIPRVVKSDPNRNFSTVSDFYIEDGSYLRVKNISLSYSIPEKLLRKVKGLSNLTIYARGQNVFTFTKYSGYDPEVSSAYFGSPTMTGGIDMFNYPRPQTWLAGIKVDF
jgi:TonB-linked SusC/RagA family outer membrane protein